jgi:hypothetical protein
MSSTVTANLRNLTEGLEWRGFLDGLRPDGSLGGWALLAADLDQPVALDLYICDLHISTTVTNRARDDVARLIDRTKPLIAGFAFNFADNTCDGAQTLLLLRRLATRETPLVIGQDIYVCIAGTEIRLPHRAASSSNIIDGSLILPALWRVVAGHLRADLAANPDRAIDQLEQEIVLRSSPLFAADWYTGTYGDVEASGLDPFEHFLRLGATLGRDAGPWFQTQAYLAAEPAAGTSGLNPLVHYELKGGSSWWPGQGKLATTQPGIAPDTPC